MQLYCEIVIPCRTNFNGCLKVMYCLKFSVYSLSLLMKVYINYIVLISLLSDNKLTQLPDTICEMKSLRELVITQNKITLLPRRLCFVRTLETISLDYDHMRYPPNG